MKNPLSLSLLFLFVVAPSVLSAGEAQPTQAPRPMVTDRPDTTESPKSVPRGFFQVEASFFDYSRDADASKRTREEQWIYGQTNLKFGVSHNSDLQVILNSYSTAKETEAGQRTTTEGFGDVTVRFKQNLWGNDDGLTALALMPYVAVPTWTRPSDKAWGGGLIVPFSIALPAPFSMGLMTQCDWLPEAPGGRQRFSFLNSITFGVAWNEKLGSYFEFVAVAARKNPFEASFNSGVTYALHPDMVFDAGVRIGLSRAAQDLGIFTGVSFRY
jgi:hypothetical protein